MSNGASSGSGCQITITSVIGTPNGFLIVTGTATGCVTSDGKPCPAVTVTLTYVDKAGQNLTLEHLAPLPVPSPPGSTVDWTAKFDINDIKCGINSEWSIVAACGCDSSCSYIWPNDPPYFVECNNCYIVTLTSDPANIPCLPAGGTLSVTFTATANPADPSYQTPYANPFTWTVNNQPAPASSVNTNGNTSTLAYDFNATGSYAVEVAIYQTDGSDCNPTDSTASMTIQIVACPSNCITITGIQSPPGQWDANCNNYTVQLLAETNPPYDFNFDFTWDFGDGTQLPNQPAQVSHPYSKAGTYTVTVSLPADGQCPATSTQLTITVPSCSTQPSGPPPSVSICQASAGSITIAFSEPVDPASAGDVQNYTVTVNGVAVQLQQSQVTYDPTKNTTTISGLSSQPGDNVGVTVQNVTSSTGTAIVADGKSNTCTSTVPGSSQQGGGGGGDSFGCLVGRMLIVLLFVLAAILTMASICIPPVATWAVPIAIVAAALATILLLIWALTSWLCPDKPCKWGLLLSAEVVLGIGLMALYFFSCCPLFLIAGIAGTLIGGGMFAGWAAACHATKCEILTELSSELTSVIMPLEAWLVALVPPLALCVSPWVAAAISTAAGIITMLALSACSSNS